MRSNKRGVALVEFAIVVMLLLVLVFGIIDFGLVLRDSLALNQIAREAARTAAIGGSAHATVQEWAAKLGLDAGLIQVTAIQSGLPPDVRVEVILNYTHSMVTGFFGSDIPLTATMVMRLEQ